MVRVKNLCMFVVSLDSTSYCVASCVHVQVNESEKTKSNIHVCVVHGIND